MTVKTRSKFYYGFTVDKSNNQIDFSEGGGQLTATMGFSSYTPTDLATEVARAMTSVGSQEYVVAFDRTNRLYNIVGIDSNFELLVSSGTSAASAFLLLGFTGSDLTGSDSYLSDTATGKAFSPQFLLQNYVDFADDEGFSQATVKKTATAKVEVVSFGQESFASFNITFQTDVPQATGAPIENDDNGVSNLREFMRYGITKGNFEFMPDRDTPNTFYEVLLESTPMSKDGVRYKLKEMYGRGLIDHFETGTIKLRKL